MENKEQWEEKILCLAVEMTGIDPTITDTEFLNFIRTLLQTTRKEVMESAKVEINGLSYYPAGTINGKPCFDKGCSCRLHFKNEKEYQEHCKKAKHNLINCNVKASGYHWDIPKLKKLALKVKKNEQEQEAQYQKELKELADLI